MLKSSVQVYVVGLILGSTLNLAEETNSILKDLQAECTHEGIRVKLWFKKEFHGIAYSNGHYETPKCRYIPPPASEASEQEQRIKPSGTNFTFLIPISECGSRSNQAASTALHKLTKRRANKNNDNEIYIENTLLIQNDPTIQEAGDLAKTLRCVWQKEIHRPLVASFPFVPVNSTQDQIKSPQRLESVSSSFQTRYGFNPYTKMNDHKLSTPTAYPKMRLRFQKKGQIQSVPNRRYFSRSLHDGDQEDEITSGELISIEYGGEEVFSEETNSNDQNNTSHLLKYNVKETNISLSPVSIALPLRTNSNQISSSLVSVPNGSHSSQFLITYQSIFAVIFSLRITFLIT